MYSTYRVATASIPAQLHTCMVINLTSASILGTNNSSLGGGGGVPDSSLAQNVFYGSAGHTLLLWPVRLMTLHPVHITVLVATAREWSSYIAPGCDHVCSGRG